MPLNPFVRLRDSNTAFSSGVSRRFTCSDRTFCLAGIGGIFVEVYKDVAIRVAPVDAEGARGMVEGLKAADILKGFRGREPYDIEYLIAALVNVSRLLTEHPEIEALDINPLILPDGGGSGVVVDAKLRVAPNGP